MSATRELRSHLLLGVTAVGRHNEKVRGTGSRSHELGRPATAALASCPRCCRRRSSRRCCRHARSSSFLRGLSQFREGGGSARASVRAVQCRERLLVSGDKATGHAVELVCAGRNVTARRQTTSSMIVRDRRNVAGEPRDRWFVAGQDDPCVRGAPVIVVVQIRSRRDCSLSVEVVPLSAFAQWGRGDAVGRGARGACKRLFRNSREYITQFLLNCGDLAETGGGSTRSGDQIQGSSQR